MKTASIRTMLAGGAGMLALAAAVPARAQIAEAPPEQAQTTADTADIIVTGTKRGEELREIAGSVSALTEQALDDLNAQSLTDYVTRVPGVVFNDYQPGVSEVVIRGIASTTYHEANQATTGYYLNQIPLVEPGFPLVIPDVDTFDIAQVEVLRGPQGTLFGSSSLGGAINYVVNEADASKLDAGFEGILSTTRRTGQPSYAAKAMINVPIVADKLAVRVVALQRRDAGYLTNVGTDEKGSDDLRVRGLRGSIVWTPAAGTTVSALSMYQEYDLDDQTYALFSLPQFQRDTNVDEYQDTSIFLNSLRLDQDLGFATLTALGSYTEKKSDLAFDDSIFLGIDARTGTPQLSGSNGKSTTDYAELRLAAPAGSVFSWVLGANYTRLRTNSRDFSSLEGIGAYIDANPGEFGNQPSSVIAPDDLVRRYVADSRVRELALFGEASYTLADIVTLTVGGRVFEYETRPTVEYLPNAVGVPPFALDQGASKESGFIPKVSIKYQPSRDFMVYALYSEGFRIGGLNVFAAGAPGTPTNFDSDKTKNYEVGTRFDLVPNEMSFDITAFHIDWNNIQARLFTPVFDSYTTNGGGADIDGVELTLTFRPARWLTYTSAVAYTDARLSSLLPDSFAPGGGYAAGTRLPGSSDWTIANQLQVDLRNTPLRPRFGIAHRYLSASPVAFGAALQKGGHSVVDVNAAVEVGRGLEVGAFVKNAFDTYGILNAPFSFAGSVQRPRTIGGSLRFSLD